LRSRPGGPTTACSRTGLTAPLIHYKDFALHTLIHTYEKAVVKSKSSR
jgi:hypothetical protein